MINTLTGLITNETQTTKPSSIILISHLNKDGNWIFVDSVWLAENFMNCFLIEKDYFKGNHGDLIYCCDTLGGKGDASGLYRGKWLKEK